MRHTSIIAGFAGLSAAHLVNHQFLHAKRDPAVAYATAQTTVWQHVTVTAPAGAPQYTGAPQASAPAAPPAPAPAPAAPNSYNPEAALSSMAAVQSSINAAGNPSVQAVPSASAVVPSAVVPTSAPVVPTSAAVVPSSAAVVPSSAAAPSYASSSSAAAPAASGGAAGGVNTGYGTYYDPEGGLGSCGGAIQQGDHIVAIGQAYGNPSYCGKGVSITIKSGPHAGETVQAKVADACQKCMEDPLGHIDLPHDWMTELDPTCTDPTTGTGKAQLTWQFTD